MLANLQVFVMVGKGNKCDNLVMVMYDTSDIRLLWSRNQRIQGQYSDSQVRLLDHLSIFEIFNSTGVKVVRFKYSFYFITSDNPLLWMVEFCK